MSLDVTLLVDTDCVFTKNTTHSVFTKNITHNLGQMATEANLYEALWCPEKLGVTTAGQLIKPLCDGMLTLLSDPNKYRQFNPPNGWGNYENLVEFVREYWVACTKYPTAKVDISR